MCQPANWVEDPAFTKIQCHHAHVICETLRPYEKTTVSVQRELAQRRASPECSSGTPSQPRSTHPGLQSLSCALGPLPTCCCWAGFCHLQCAWCPAACRGISSGLRPACPLRSALCSDKQHQGDSGLRRTEGNWKPGLPQRSISAPFTQETRAFLSLNLTSVFPSNTRLCRISGRKPSRTASRVIPPERKARGGAVCPP